MPRQTHLTFAHARKTPPGGWSKATGDHLIAADAMVLGMHLCLQEKFVYDWLVRHGVVARKRVFYERDDTGKRALSNPLCQLRLVGRIIDDKPLGTWPHEDREEEPCQA